MPGQPLTPEEFAEREPIWNAQVRKEQDAQLLREAEQQRRMLERQRHRQARERQPLTPPPPIVAAPRVGRNEPCPCGSGRKFKKCCGR